MSEIENGRLGLYGIV